MKPILWTLAGLIAAGSSAAHAEVLRLQDVISLAERNDHRIAAEEMSEMAAGERVDIEKSRYYPKLDFEAIDSAGFPGSTGVLGIGGIMGSPYRKGTAAGLVAQLNVFDFGRTSHAVRAAKHEQAASREQSRLSQIDIDLETTKLFFDCVRLRAQSEIWKFAGKEARTLAEEIGRYVKTGQRSVVERYLADSQVEESSTGESDADQRMRLVLARLGTLTGTDLSRAECPEIDTLPAVEKGFSMTAGTHPLLAKEQAEANAANERLAAAKAEHLPKVVAVGSFGYLDSSRLVTKKDCGVGVGLAIPLFDGFRTFAGVREAADRAAERSFRIQADQEGIEKRNDQYDEVIAASNARLEHLDREIKIARKGFDLAKERYLGFRGQLVDVREALRNLERAETQYRSTRIDLDEGKVSKAIFNGARTAKGTL